MAIRSRHVENPLPRAATLAAACQLLKTRDPFVWCMKLHGLSDEKIKIRLAFRPCSAQRIVIVEGIEGSKAFNRRSLTGKERAIIMRKLMQVESEMFRGEDREENFLSLSEAVMSRFTSNEVVAQPALGPSLRVLALAALLLPAEARARWAEEWRAELDTLQVHRQRNQFMLETLIAAVVMAFTLRQAKSTFLMGVDRLIDSTLVSEWRTWLAAAVPTVASAVYFFIEENDGLHGVAANLENVAIVAAFTYGVLRLWRRSRGITVEYRSRD